MSQDVVSRMIVYGRKAMGLAFLVAVSFGISVYAAKHAAETVFFDKFVYYKSPEFGYWPNDELTLRSFGRRGADIESLDQYTNNSRYPVPAGVLGAPVEQQDAKKTRIIVVIGDSYVWGQGVRNNNRFPVLLEKRLNAAAPTRVISLARQGDGLFDHYAKYELAKYAYPDADLFIFGIVDNDITLFSPNFYNEAHLQSLIRDCGDRPFLYAMEDGHAEEEYFGEQYSNYCVFQTVMPRLPRRNVVYFDYGSEYFGQFPDNGRSAVSVVRDAGLPFLSALPEIRSAAAHNESGLYISHMDSHPSARANEIFADVLYRHIISLPGFFTK